MQWVEVGSTLRPVEFPANGTKIKTTAPNNNTNLMSSKEEMSTTTDYFERKLDDKRRLTIPAELRAEFEQGVVITRGFRDYLHLYPLDVWKQDMENALIGDILDERIADLNVQFRTGKVGGDMDDKQGRIVIEQHLLDYAGIDRDVVVVRAGKYWRISAAR